MDGATTGSGASCAVVEEASPAVVRFGQTAAADLRRLVSLHDREPTAELLEGLREQPLQDLFGLRFDRADARQAMALVAELVGDLPSPIDAADIDDLADDFTAIHQTGAYGASPVESVWRHEEPRHRPDVEERVAAWYRRFGVAHDDPRAPDHLVPELRFLAGLLDRGALIDAAAFLDQHALRWVPAFCRRIASRCRTPYFAGVALLTSAYLDGLRDRLDDAFGLPRPDKRRKTHTETLDFRREWSDG